MSITITYKDNYCCCWQVKLVAILIRKVLECKCESRFFGEWLACQILIENTQSCSLSQIVNLS